MLSADVVSSPGDSKHSAPALANGLPINQDKGGFDTLSTHGVPLNILV